MAGSWARSRNPWLRGLGAWSFDQPRQSLNRNGFHGNEFVIRRVVDARSQVVDNVLRYRERLANRPA